MNPSPSDPIKGASTEGRTLIKIAAFGGVTIAAILGFQSYRQNVESTEAQEQWTRDHPPTDQTQNCQIKIGTIASEVVRCLGVAPDIQRSETQNTKIQHWTYPGGRYFMLVNGKVWKMEWR